MQKMLAVMWLECVMMIKKYSINYDNQKRTLPQMIKVIKESCNHITGINNLSMLAAKLVEILRNEDSKQQK